MRTFAGIVGAACLAITTAAGAQDAQPSAADVSTARALGQEGVKLADDGNCQEAIDRLARAEKLFHAPTTLLRLGECQVKVSKLVEGTENLNRVVREPLAAGAPAVFREAQERARALLAEARPRLARLTITLRGDAGGVASVRLDGESVPSANLGTTRFADPGAHVVTADAPGFKNARATVQLTEGGTESVTLTLERDPSAVIAASPPPVSTPASPNEPSSGSRRGPAVVALAGGAAGLGVGTIFGLLALGKKSDLDAACTSKVCPTAAAQDTIDRGKTYATVSTIGFAVGAAGVVLGVVLFLTDRSPGRASVTTAVVTGRDLQLKLAF